MAIYRKYRTIKDKYRVKLQEEHRENEKKEKMVAIKRNVSGVDNTTILTGTSSFVKQAEDNEYADFVKSDYSQSTSAEKRSKFKRNASKDMSSQNLL